MSERRTVNVDMDGVIADFDGALETALQAAHPGIIVPSRHLHFYMSRRTDDPTFAEKINAIKDAQGFFRNLLPIENALEGWHTIEELGYHPRVLSSPLTSNVWCEEEKLEWLERHYGSKVADEAVLTKDKHRYDGIALIDDRPEIADGHLAPWQHVIFTQPYNETIETEFRLRDWQDPNLAQILARCAERYEKFAR